MAGAGDGPQEARPGAPNKLSLLLIYALMTIYSASRFLHPATCIAFDGPVTRRCTCDVWVLDRCLRQVLHLAVLPAVCATASQVPMMPYLWDRLGGSSYGYGLMMTEYGALQLCGNLFSGEWSWKLNLQRLGSL